ncbi:MULTISPECIES: relaxase/mobilization nuclease domain-containing protein [unclassified Mesorhizobium]|uniref:relaxase/mobilization nuclease domain-containing protein n=1 Tax=unclassified Mesorhizobium TaxID=325217 RepID=UPI000FD5B798|nr:MULTISPECIES: relaxase/mobilization nuclease domain-containing protein [unclassified Mesorhizobium]RUU85377.1 endonuclease [Mesorhizobium sp. M7A.F.Ca.MR.176.00.0.0]RWN48808.1 MAG: endonuclease [Mesorhizobium sp.]RWN59672.1 MAG: endonuclease [Mesorhizobium sp.]RWN68552.1 MAG: endonuclease [Mesorhizobium sp.]RWN70763.1 MAG: endonuclease [Mesorhizobium sp.]
MPPQAIIRIVPRGGARTARQIRDQLNYLSREGTIDLLRSSRHQGVAVPYDRLHEMAHSWAEQTGNYQPGQPEAESNQDLTTHIIVSFPRGTDTNNAHAAGRAWVENIVGSGRQGGTFDYITAFHVDRQHPHLHVVVNRRALEGHWLKISRRHPYHNYNNMRAALVDAAYDNGIELDATSRAERGIMERPITYAEFRRRERAGETVAIRPHPEPDVPVTPRGSPGPTNLGDGDRGPRPGPHGPSHGDAPGQASGSNAGPATRDNTVDEIRLGDDFDSGRRSDSGGQGQAAGHGTQDESGFEQQRQARRRRRPETEPEDAGSNTPQHPRQRRRYAPGIIETRAQRAAREQREADERARRHVQRPEELDSERPEQRKRRRYAPGIIETRAQQAAREQREADERARRHHRREPDPQDLDPNQPRRLRSGRVVERSRHDPGGSR